MTKTKGQLALELSKKNLRCPRCAIGTLVFQQWGPGLVAVCRHTNSCGFRMYLEANHAMTVGEVERYVRNRKA
jgi:hypothetical protein